MTPTTTPNTASNIQRRILRISVSGGPAHADLRFENLFDGANGVRVNLDRVVDVFAVPARHDSCNGHFAVVTLTQDAHVALAQAVDRQCERSEVVTAIRIRARELND